MTHSLFALYCKSARPRKFQLRTKLNHVVINWPTKCQFSELPSLIAHFTYSQRFRRIPWSNMTATWQRNCRPISPVFVLISRRLRTNVIRRTETVLIFGRVSKWLSRGEEIGNGCFGMGIAALECEGVSSWSLLCINARSRRLISVRIRCKVKCVHAE